MMWRSNMISSVRL